MNRGDAAAATWIVRGDESRRRRGCDVNSPRRRVASRSGDPFSSGVPAIHLRTRLQSHGVAAIPLRSNRVRRATTRSSARPRGRVGREPEPDVERLAAQRFQQMPRQRLEAGGVDPVRPLRVAHEHRAAALRRRRQRARGPQHAAHGGRARDAAEGAHRCGCRASDAFVRCCARLPRLGRVLVLQALSATAHRELWSAQLLRDDACATRPTRGAS